MNRQAGDPHPAPRRTVATRQSALIFDPEMARTDVRGYGRVVHGGPNGPQAIPGLADRSAAEFAIQLMYRLADARVGLHPVGDGAARVEDRSVIAASEGLPDGAQG